MPRSAGTRPGAVGRKAECARCECWHGSWFQTTFKFTNLAFTILEFTNLGEDRRRVITLIWTAHRPADVRVERQARFSKPMRVGLG